MKKEQLKQLIKEEVKKILSEDSNQVIDSYKKILELIRIESKKLNDNDSYELHEKLKTWFNKLIEDKILKEEKQNNLNKWVDILQTETEELKQLMKKKGYNV